MKFLEFTTTLGNKVLLNINQIEAISYYPNNNEKYKYIIHVNDNEYGLTETDYNRITQTIDKVDHL